MLAYRIPSSVPWGQLFSVMEDLKAGRHPGTATAPAGDQTDGAPSPSIVEVYAASDTSLEQVFLSFAREAGREEESLSVPSSPIVVLRASQGLGVPQGPVPSGVSGTAGVCGSWETFGVDKDCSPGSDPFQREVTDESAIVTKL